MSSEACLEQGQKASKKGPVGGQPAPVGFPELTAPPVYLTSDKWGGRKFVPGCSLWELSLLVRLSGGGEGAEPASSGWE